MKKETEEKRQSTLEEKRLIEIREKLSNNELLDEYTKLYMRMVLGYASTLNVNFDNLKE